MKNRIRELRKARGMTQQQLAERVGVSRQTIIAAEAGRYEPSIWFAFRIARIFEKTIEEVFLFEESVCRLRTQSGRGETPG